MISARIGIDSFLKWMGYESRWKSDMLEKLNSNGGQVISKEFDLDLMVKMLRKIVSFLGLKTDLK